MAAVCTTPVPEQFANSAAAAVHQAGHKQGLGKDTVHHHSVATVAETGPVPRPPVFPTNKQLITLKGALAAGGVLIAIPVFGQRPLIFGMAASNILNVMQFHLPIPALIAWKSAVIKISKCLTKPLNSLFARNAAVREKPPPVWFAITAAARVWALLSKAIFCTGGMI